MLPCCLVCRYFTPEADRAIEKLIPAKRREYLSSLPAERRKQSLLAEAILRACLAGLSGEAAESIAIERPEGGKPHTAAMEFSLSHTKGAVAVALSDRPVGVDIEARRAPRLRAARRLFSEREIENIGAFWEIWTRKEALYKATGVAPDAAHDTLRPPAADHLSTETRFGFTVSVWSEEQPEFIYFTEEELLLRLKNQ